MRQFALQFILCCCPCASSLDADSERRTRLITPEVGVTFPWHLRWSSFACRLSFAQPFFFHVCYNIRHLSAKSPADIGNKHTNKSNHYTHIFIMLWSICSVQTLAYMSTAVLTFTPRVPIHCVHTHTHKESVESPHSKVLHLPPLDTPLEEGITGKHTT